MMKRALRTRFSLLKPHMSSSMVDAEDEQREFHDKGMKMRIFQKVTQSWLEICVVEWKSGLLVSLLQSKVL